MDRTPNYTKFTEVIGLSQALSRFVSTCCSVLKPESIKHQIRHLVTSPCKNVGAGWRNLSANIRFPIWRFVQTTSLHGRVRSKIEAKFRTLWPSPYKSEEECEISDSIWVNFLCQAYNPTTDILLNWPYRLDGRKVQRWNIKLPDYRRAA